MTTLTQSKPLLSGTATSEFSKNDTLDWSVVKCPVIVRLPNGQDMQLQNRNALVRDDSNGFLGQVSNLYEPFQNESLKEIIAPHIEEGILEIVNQGFLGGGRRVFIQAKMTSEFQGAGEKHYGMLSLLNSHDGSCPLSLGVTATRVVCQNTFAMAMSDMSSRIRHYADIHSKAQVLGLEETIAFIEKGMKEYTEGAEVLAKTPATPDTVGELIRRAFKKDEEDNVRSKDKIIDLFRNGTGNEGKTLWDAFNGVTEYITHHSRKKEDSRFSYTNFGSGSHIARRAMDVALSLA